MDIITTENSDYSNYEDLLFRRDRIKKEAKHWQLEYTREFGELVTEVFHIKIECIRKKKTLTYCTAVINKGKPINLNELQAVIEKEMKDYNRQLHNMIAANKAAKNVTMISETDYAKVKSLYRKLAKKLHPDINPRTNDDPELKNLWQMIVAGYNANDLEELEDAEVLVNRVFRELGVGENISVHIVDVEARIKALSDEIASIKAKEPYRYKYLLSDAEAVAEKRKSLEAEKKQYEEYEKELDKLMDMLMEGK
jgi:hypothetical protein